MPAGTRARLTAAAALMHEGQVKPKAQLLSSDDAGNRLGWLLKATLARRMGDLPGAETAILAAARLGADADVELEAGNIAAAQGKTDLARQAWETAVSAAPESDAGKAAKAALERK